MMQAYVKGSVEAVALYQKAFDAKLVCGDPNQKVSYDHAELDIYGQNWQYPRRKTGNARAQTATCSFACTLILMKKTR